MTTQTPKEGIAPKQRRWSVPQIICIIGALIGAIVVMYSPAADWFARRGQQGAIATYAKTVETVTDPEQEAMIAAAHEYNQRLPIVNMVDPYGPDAEKFTGDPGERSLYESLLNLGDSQPMGWISISSANITMPVYHGTADSTLKRGAGHLFGSSLPVGGKSTRAIITGHSGDPRAKLFTKLHDLKIGDTFALSTLSEDLYYRIREVRTITPDEVEGLGIVPGEDLVTLITCTPVGVNTHRLVVTGERIPAPLFEEAAEYPLDASQLGVGFPWWIIPILVLPPLAGWVSRPAGARASKKASEATVADDVEA